MLVLDVFAHRTKWDAPLWQCMPDIPTQDAKIQKREILDSFPTRDPTNRVTTGGITKVDKAKLTRFRHQLSQLVSALKEKDTEENQR